MVVRSRFLPAAVVLALALGCDAPGPLVATPAGGRALGPREQVRPQVIEALDQLVAADPRLPGFDGWPLAFAVRFHDHARDACAIDLVQGSTPVRHLEGVLDATGCRATWDGRDESGATVRPGGVHATCRLLDAAGTELARVTSALEVVRLGLDRVQLTAASGARVPLLYRATGGLRDGWYEVGASDAPWQLAPDVAEVGGAPLELADGTDRALPIPSDDVLSPPLDPGSADGVEHDTFSLPTAWVAGSTVRASVRSTSSLAGLPAGGDPLDVDVRVVAPEGWTIEGDDRFADGAELTIQSDASPVPAVGRYDAVWSVSFEARRGDGEWQPIPGAFPITLRLYGLVATPVFDSTGVPHRAWVDVVDHVAGWVDGATAGESAVAAAIVEGVYDTAGLRYDTARGASFYTEYARGFSGAVFAMQSYEDRRYGSIINCTDAASIVSAYANMTGIDLRYHILTNARGIDYGFDLNFIQAIGMPAFDETPFDSGRGGFRYHAIVGSRDGRTWDATLALDGDGAPGTAPFAQRLVQGMAPADYLRALSSEWDQIQTELDEKVRIQ